jgi:diaminopimelate decarboxylase
MIVECRVCGFAVDVSSGGEIPLACPACGAKPTRIVARTDVLSPRRMAEVARILDGVPDVPPEPGDEVEEAER